MDDIKMNGILEDEKNGKFYIETNQEITVEKILKKSREIAQSCKNISKIATEFEAEFGSDAWGKLYKFEKESHIPEVK